MSPSRNPSNSSEPGYLISYCLAVSGHLALSDTSDPRTPRAILTALLEDPAPVHGMQQTPGMKQQAPSEAADDPAKHVADLQAVLDVSLELAATDSLPLLVLAVERAARKVLECEGATLLLFDRQRGTLTRPSVDGGRTEQPVQWALASEVAHSGHRVELDDPAADPRFEPAPDDAPPRNLAFFPLADSEQEIVGVLQVRDMPPRDPWDDELIKVFDAQVGVAVQRQLLLEHFAEKQRIERDLKIARNIQQGLLPKANPTFEGFDVAGWNDPADDTGGDFWDHHELPDGALALVLADATGHGIGPALMAAACRSLIRATTSLSHDLTEVVTRVNLLLHQDLSDSRSVTAVLAVLQGDALSFLSAGHGPILRYLAAPDRIHMQPAHGIPLGILPDYDWPAAERVVMEPGDLMIWVTDGFFEWENAAGEEFGIGRVQEIILANRALPAAELIRALYDAVISFVGDSSQTDDLTALIVRKL